MWSNGQVCPEVLQGIMAPWSRRPGCDKVEKKPCPGSRELERRALDGTDWKRALDGENLRRALKKGTWS
ncbi:hypothetical protein TNCV_1276121 [Trichonephila clavipes]|nr:hypothetical protein TNCV_1276121 [Trichonephila clavipes]